MVNSNNIEGHRARLDMFLSTKPRQEAMQLFVGKSPLSESVGFREVQIISRHHPLDKAYIIDIGCGIGRMTKFVKDFPIRRYFGTDILPELLEEAAEHTKGDSRFAFKAIKNIEIPEANAVADIVSAFSVITHLLDEEVYLYFREAARVLKSGGVAVFSFLDYSLPDHRKQFEHFISTHHNRHDVLKFFEKRTLEYFASLVGFEVIDIQDAGDFRHTKLVGYELPGGVVTDETFEFAQSVIYLRKP